MPTHSRGAHPSALANAPGVAEEVVVPATDGNRRRGQGGALFVGGGRGGAAGEVDRLRQHPWQRNPNPDIGTSYHHLGNAATGQAAMDAAAAAAAMCAEGFGYGGAAQGHMPLPPGWPQPGGAWDGSAPGAFAHLPPHLRPPNGMPGGDGGDVGADGGAARQYEQLLDDHSAHYIIIRKGVTLDAAPEFASFQRTHAAMWHILAGMLLQLEGICVQYAVPLATIDGRRLAALCYATPPGVMPPVEHLLACIENIQEVAAVLRMPGRRFQGPDGAAAAATAIQAHVRGCLHRKVCRAGSTLDHPGTPGFHAG